MTTLDGLVADVIAAAGGEIVGRIRLQKILYLLEQHGLNAKGAFRYHHYGPYSRVLDDALDRAKALKGVTEDIGFRKDGAAYSIFRVNGRQIPNKIGGIEADDVRQLISLMKPYAATVLELAATIHWLVNVEKITDWQEELTRRKGVKAQGGRTQLALTLLGHLQLAPA
jgi:uncharacterized protein YwgA